MPYRCLECNEIIPVLPSNTRRKHQMEKHGLEKGRRTDFSKFSDIFMTVKGMSGEELINYIKSGTIPKEEPNRYYEMMPDGRCYLLDNYENRTHIKEVHMVEPGVWE